MDFSQSMANPQAAPVVSNNNGESARYFDLVLSWGLRLVLFLVPVTFLPWTFEIFEFNKQLLLLGLSLVLLVVWLVKAVVTKKASLVKSPLNLAVLGLFLVVILATVFSIDPVTSILGFYGRFNGGLLSLVAYLIVYFLILQSINKNKEPQWLLGSWLSGIGLGALLLLLQLVGLRWLPFAAASLSSFTPLGGSLNAVAVVLVASLPLALYMSRAAGNKVGRVLSLVFTVLALIVLFLVDYQLGWISLIVATVLWLGFVFWKNEPVNFNWTLLPALALLLSVIAWPVATPALTQVAVPVEVNLSMATSWKVALQNAKISPILGTGPETFIYGFSKFKPDNFNDSNFWAFRFDKASSEFAQLLATTGYLGLLAYLAVLLMALYLSWKILKNKTGDNWYLRAASVTTLIVIIVGNVFYFSNTVLSFNLWLILAILAGLSSNQSRDLSLKTSPRASFMFSFGLAVVVLAAAGAWFGGVRFWLADAAYAKAQTAAGQVETLDQSYNELVKAVTLNPWRDTYRIGLAQVLLTLANKEASQTPAVSDEGKQAQLQKIQSYIASSIAAARSATELSKSNVANWEALGSIYRGTVLFARDAEGWIIDSFEKAVSLEPSNPALYTELAKAYLLSANRNRQEAANEADEANKLKLEAEAAQSISKAVENLDKAVKLKNNYTPAHFNIALALEQQGKMDEAIDKLKSMKDYNPQDIDVLYELASLYYLKEQYDKSEESFKLITSLVPNHANAHYGLSLVYQKKQETDKAISQLEKVLELNPGNVEVQKQLDSLMNPTLEPVVK
ncbi:tetratricopeptide repeat protein [Patescibacteria group bacterium]|nr:tetratricopeptide repeat protein [Patescibacteria group bacterium]